MHTLYNTIQDNTILDHLSWHIPTCTRVCTAHEYVYSVCLVQGNTIARMPAEYMLYRTFGYLCGNIIYANYASSCEGA